MADMHRVLPAECILDFKRTHPMPVDMVRQILDEAKANGEVGCDIDTDILARLYVGHDLWSARDPALGSRRGRSIPNASATSSPRVFMEGICRPTGRLSRTSGR